MPLTVVLEKNNDMENIISYAFFLLTFFMSISVNCKRLMHSDKLKIHIIHKNTHSERSILNILDIISKVSTFYTYSIFYDHVCILIQMYMSVFLILL